MSYYDNTGLLRKFGTEKTSAHPAGEYKTFGSLRLIEIKLDLTTLTSSAAIIDDVTFFPKGMRIEQVDVVADAAATSSGSATLDIGLIATDRSTEIDYNGLIAAMPKTSIDATGEKTSSTAGSTYAGALVGTTNATVGYLVANYNTAAFTAGTAFVRIYYNVP